MLRRIALLLGAALVLVACVRLTMVESAPDLHGATHTATSAAVAGISTPSDSDAVATITRTAAPITAMLGRAQTAGRSQSAREAASVIVVLLFAAVLIGSTSAAEFDRWRRDRSDRGAPTRHLLDLPRFILWRGPPVVAFARR